MHTTSTPTRHRPVPIAPETFVIQGTYGEGQAPLVVHMNAMLIRGAEPVVVDTGAPINREQFLEDLFSLVEPEDVRWVFISHDDSDHYGALHEVMDACPNATLVANWFLCERLGSERLDVPPTRWKWVADGESFSAGDRELVAVRPPTYDSPTTRGLFDPTTGVYWAADSYATPVPVPAADVSELDPEFWAGGFVAFQGWIGPWLSVVDPAKFEATCRRIEQLGVTTIAGTHGPAITGANVAKAFEMMRAMPTAVVPPQPGPEVLEQIVASLLAEAVA